MRSFSRMRDVFQIEISFLTYHEDICGEKLVHLRYGFIFHNQQLTLEVEGRVIKLLGCVTNFDCQLTYHRIFSNQNISNKTSYKNCDQIPSRECRPNLVSQVLYLFLP